MPERKRVRQVSPPTIKGDDEMSKGLTKYVTTRQAAEMLGVSRNSSRSRASLKPHRSARREEDRRLVTKSRSDGEYHS